MAHDYARALAKVVVAQIAEITGFDSMQQSALDSLADLLLRYISEIGSTSHAYAELAGRTDCNVNDVLLAFQDLGISMDELMSYADSMEEVPFAHAIPTFPVVKRPHPTQSFAQKGEEPPKHIPSYLPAFPDKHTYVDTPTYAGHDKDPARQKAAAIKARKAEEDAVVKLAKRAEAESSPVPLATAEADTLKDSVTNPFLATPVLEEEPRQPDQPQSSAMDLDAPEAPASEPVSWEETTTSAAPNTVLQLAAPLKLDWKGPVTHRTLLDPSALGFEDAFASAVSEEPVEKATTGGGRRRKPTAKARGLYGADPNAQRAEYLLAAGPEALALEDIAGEKGGR